MALDVPNGKPSNGTSTPSSTTPTSTTTPPISISISTSPKTSMTSSLLTFFAPHIVFLIVSPILLFMFAYGAITSWIFEGAPLFPKAEKRKLSTIELPKVDAYVCRVRKTKVSHEVISGHRTGWFKEEEYYVPLEQGSTLLSRKRACRHRKTLGAILLIHGFAQNRKTWDTPNRSLVNYLAEAGYDVFYMDLRGSSQSVKLGAPRATSIREFIELDVKQTLNVIQIVSSHKMVYLIGHSMGGAIACSAAGRYPEIVGGVIHVAGVYGFSQNSNQVMKVFLKGDAYLRKYLSWLPKTLIITTREIGYLLRIVSFIINSPLGLFVPVKIFVVGSIEMNILTQYLSSTFEPTTVGVLQSLTSLGHGEELLDENGENYLKTFEDLQIPLLVICADNDDLICIEDSLLCFYNSNSKDKAKLVYTSKNHQGVSAYGHCDIMIGKHAVTHVWEKLRIWLDQRRKLGFEMQNENHESYFLLEALSSDLQIDDAKDEITES